MSVPVSADNAPTYNGLWKKATGQAGAKVNEFKNFKMVAVGQGLTLYYFTKPNHPAHPGVVVRVISKQGDGSWVASERGMSFGPDKTQPAFKAWLAEFAELDRQMSKSLGSEAAGKRN